MDSTKIRWGIVSTARIGIEKVIPGIQRSQTGVAHAIASRDRARAEDAAGKLGIGKAYGSYEELLADPEIDAIYNPLPNHLHVPVTIQAVEAGKHVLCEKPIALTAQEAEQLLDLPRDRLVAENFMVRAHPQWIRAREIVRSGELGDLKAIQAFFSYFNDDPANIRNMADIGGGALYDIGCYTMLAGRYFFDGEPERVVSLIDRDPEFGTDRTTSALLDFGQGRHLNFVVSTQLAPYQRFQLVGTKKRLEIVIPVNAPQGEAVTIRLDDGSILGDGAMRSETIAACDQYAELADVFGRAIRGDVPLPYGAEDAVRNMKVLDALFASAAQGGWVAVK
ncbi:Gfo/Idh/MocA family oxidoreductase [Labrenzia sp. 011]|uniref:Gfo/Idh/MocA family protein n=1 Tax=Labrenzia sp. 011 TaxID=2171494 RepID=UPI000D50ADFA|nr:Gfo/Idh/MocA family oxidoreductase [Labrenzia sp. 011]PVB61533.1 NAD-binding protein [Labrenzia sp. 011]